MLRSSLRCVLVFATLFLLFRARPHTIEPRESLEGLGDTESVRVFKAMEGGVAPCRPLRMLWRTRRTFRMVFEK